MLGTDVVVTELERLTQRELEDLLGPGGERDVSTRSLRTLADDLDDLLSHRFEADPHRLSRATGCDALALVDEAQQDVLGSDVVVVEKSRFFLREDHNPPGPVGEPFKHSLLTSNDERCGALRHSGALRSIATGPDVSREPRLHSHLTVRRCIRQIAAMPVKKRYRDAAVFPALSPTHRAARLDVADRHGTI